MLRHLNQFFSAITCWFVSTFFIQYSGCLFPKNVMVYVIAENICATFRSSSIIWHDKNSLAVENIVEEA